MKASALPPEPELRRLIAKACGEAVGSVGIAENIDVTFGRTKPTPEWHFDAFGQVDQLRLSGASQGKACRLVHDRFGPKSNIQLESFEREYQRHTSERLKFHFWESVFRGELDEAVYALRLCSASSRVEIWREIEKRLVTSR